MPSSFSFRLLLVAAVLAAAAPAAWARTWTNHQGKQIEADYVRLDGQNVVLLMKGREFSVPLIQLSAADKRYVFQRAAGIAEAPVGNPPAGEAAGEESSSSEDEAESAKSEDAPRRSDAARGVARIREWTDDKGNTIRAKFIRIHEENVILMQGRKVVPCPVAKLSAADQDYVRELLAARGEEDLLASVERLASNRQGEYSADAAGMPMPGAMAGAAGYVPPGMPAGGYTPPTGDAGAYGEDMADVAGYSPPVPGGMSSGHDVDTGYTPPSMEDAGSPSYAMGGAGGYNAGAAGGYNLGGYPSSGNDAGGYQSPGMDDYASSGHDAGPGAYGAGGYGGSGMGSEIASASMPPPSMPSVPTLEWVHECSQCGKQVSDEDTSCPHCGVRFINAKGGGPSYASNNNDNDNSSSGNSFRLRGRGAAKLIGLAITGLLVVIGAIARVLGVGSDR